MDPIPRTTLANTIAPTIRIGETAAVTPATAPALATPQGAVGLVASAQVDISPLGQFLSGVALSRRQMLALQGLAEQPNGGAQQAGVNADLLAVAQQLTQSFAQLQTSGIDASQLAASGNNQNNLAQRYDLLAGDGTTDTAGALTQNGNLLTQAGLSRIGIDLRGDAVDPAALQAAFEADRAGTLDALQQGTDVMAQVGAVLAQQQGQVAASVVAADLSAQSPVQQAGAIAAPAAPDGQVYAQSDVQAGQQAAALARRQLEVQQQMENEELVQDMQLLQTQQATQTTELSQNNQLNQNNQLSEINQDQQLRQLQDSDAATQRAQALQDDQQRVQAERNAREQFDAERVARDQQLQQQAASEFEQQRLSQLQTGQAQQAQLQQRARQAADEAAQAQLNASEAQIAARAASERAQQLAREAQFQLDAGQAATAQAQLAQQNSEAQLQAARNAAQINPPPSSQDPSVAAAIAAYNLTNMAASSGLAGRAAGDAQKPLVAPVAAVEPAKPVNQIQPNIDSRT